MSAGVASSPVRDHRAGRFDACASVPRSRAVAKVGLARWLSALLAVVAVCVAPAAQAQVRVSFYSHPWGFTSSYIYFPHAFIVVEPDGASSSLRGPASFGFTAVNATAVLITKHGPGEIIPEDDRYRAVSTLHFSVVVSDEQYASLSRGIDAWRSVKGDPYDLNNRNCITFIAEMARLAGLKVAASATLDPAVFLESVRRANLERIAADAPDAATRVATAKTLN